MCHRPVRDLVPDESTESVEELNRRLMLQNVQRQFERRMAILRASPVPDQFVNHINAFLEGANVRVRLVGIEPVTADDHPQGLRLGGIVVVAVNPNTGDQANDPSSD